MRKPEGNFFFKCTFLEDLEVRVEMIELCMVSIFKQLTVHYSVHDTQLFGIELAYAKLIKTKDLFFLEDLINELLLLLFVL